MSFERAMGNSRLIRIAIILAIIALLLFIVERVWVFGQFIGGVISTLVAAWFVAFLIRPLITHLQTGIVPPAAIAWLQRQYPALPVGRLSLLRMPMPMAVAVAYAILLVILIGSATIATATVIPQAADLINRIPGFAASLPAQVADLWAGIAERFGFDPGALDQFIASQDIPGAIARAATIAATQLLSLAAVTAGFIGQVFLVLTLSLYIVVEDQLLMKQLFALLPLRSHEMVSAMLRAVDRAFSGYLRGQFIGALLRGVCTLLIFALFQVKFGVVVALAFALLSFIPLIGGLIGIAFGVIVTLIVNVEAAVPVALLMAACDQVVAYAVMPRLMKDMVGVPGLVALLAISLGVQLLGFWGVIFGVPFAGAIYALLFDFYLPRRQGLPQPIVSEPPVASQAVAAPTSEKREDVVAPALKRSSS
jgi:predicted PurR-regulated permease PerM